MHIVAVAYLTASGQQHGTTFLQDFQRLFVKAVGFVEIFHLEFLIFHLPWIDPEIPAIFNIFRELHHQRQLARRRDSSKRLFDSTKGDVLACLQCTGKQMTLTKNAIAILDDIGSTGIRQTGHESIIRLDGNPKRLVVGIDELGETRQRYNDTTELTPIFSRTIALLTPMNIERTNESRSLATIVVES